LPGYVKSTALAAAVAAATMLTIASADAATVKEIFEKYNLLGTLASDCAKPADAKSPYLMNRVIDADHVELDKMVGPTSRESATIVDRIMDAKPNELTLSATIGDQRYDIHVQVQGGRVRTTESTRADGQKVIAGGHFTDGGGETPWYGRCLQKVTIRNAPDGGGKCIQALNGDIKSGVRLQAWDCNDTPPQIFAFDTINGSVSVGDLCVDTEGERSEQGVALQLASCNNAATQTFKVEPNANYVKLVGVGGFCVEIDSAYKGAGPVVHLWQCGGTARNQEWQFTPALDLTLEENSGRSGHFVANFDLPGADPRLCQTACISNGQCTAWNYRKPEGQGNHQPHCWLFDKTESINGNKLVVTGVVRPEAK
jgi:hypothetical protein